MKKKLNKLVYILKPHTYCRPKVWNTVHHCVVLQPNTTTPLLWGIYNYIFILGEHMMSLSVLNLPIIIHTSSTNTLESPTNSSEGDFNKPSPHIGQMDSEPPEDHWRRRIACGLLPLEISPRMGIDTFKYSNLYVIVIITCGVQYYIQVYVLPCTHLWTVNGIMRSTMISTSQLQFKISMEWWTRFHRAGLTILEHSGRVYVSIGRCGCPAWQNHLPKDTHYPPQLCISATGDGHNVTDHTLMEHKLCTYISRLNWLVAFFLLGMISKD